MVLSVILNINKNYKVLIMNTINILLSFLITKNNRRSETFSETS
jgi:hypothetical protein